MHPVGGYDRVEEVLSPDEYESRKVSHYLGKDLHRTDGPAVIRYRKRESNTPYVEMWFIHGKLSRSDGPAAIEYDGERVTSESYFLDGREHRLDGPAVVGYDRFGRVNDYDFFVHGVLVEEHLIPRIREALEDGAPVEWAVAYAAGSES